MKRIHIAATVLLSTYMISACTDGTQTGGGAGDSPANAGAVAQILPLVGLYALPENWEGLPTSTAFIEIQQPDASGTSTVIIRRQDEFLNCIEPSPTFGTASKDPFSDRIFLDEIFELPDSVLTLSGTGLIIDLPSDVQDVDNDSNTDEPASLQATRIDMMASDLPDTCV